MIQTWSDNNTVVVDIETFGQNQDLIFKLYDKYHDSCTTVILNKQKLKDLAKFIDTIIESNSNKEKV